MSATGGLWVWAGWSVGLAAPPVVVPSPDWVQDVQPSLDTPPPQGMPSPAVQYLLVDDQVWIEQSGVSRFSRVAARVLTRDGLETLGTIEIESDPAVGEVRLHTLGVFRGGQWRDLAADAELAVVQKEDRLWQDILDGTQTNLIILPDVRVGDVVVWAWSESGDNPVFGGRFADEWDMGWSVPAARRYLSVRWPAARSLTLREVGWVGKPERHMAGEWERLVWDLRDVPALSVPGGLPRDVTGWPVAHLSEWASWAELVRWALPLYAVGPADDAAVASLASELGAAEMTPVQWFSRASRWVQDEVRYFGDEVGAGSHAPRGPALVLRRRYGDCKDKSLLLAALLRAGGVEAWPALARSRGGGDPARLAVSPLVFDHAVVAAEFDGALHFVDPTRTGQGGDGASIAVGDLGHILLIRPGESGLERVHVPEAARPGRALDLTVSGSVEAPVFSLVETWTGAKADSARSWLADLVMESFHEARGERWAPSQGARVDVSVPELQDDREENRVRVTESWSLEDGWSEGVLDLPPSRLPYALPYPDESRTLPLALDQGLRESETVRVELGDVDPVGGEDLQVVTQWFRVTQSHTELPEGFVVERSLEVLADRVLASDFDAYRAAMGKVDRGVALELEDPNAPDDGWMWLGLLSAITLMGGLIPGLALGLVAGLLLAAFAQRGHGRSRSR